VVEAAAQRTHRHIPRTHCQGVDQSRPDLAGDRQVPGRCRRLVGVTEELTDLGGRRLTQTTQTQAVLR
jgi:hypothetical protein